MLFALSEEDSAFIVLTFGTPVLALSPKFRKAVGKVCIDEESPETVVSSSATRSVTEESVSSDLSVTSLLK